jgi:peptide/nickel transport system substrate-binding protein
MFDADLDLTPLMHTRADRTPDYPNDPDLDVPIEAGRSEIDVAKRRGIYARVQRNLWDMTPAIFGMQVEDMYGVSNRVNWKPRPDEMIWAKEMTKRG